MNLIPGYFRRRRLFDDLSEEMRLHLEERVEHLIAEGLNPQEAERQARIGFGNVTMMEERSRAVWQWPTAESIVADVRFALRQLVKSPGFIFTATLTLGLGIAVNATIFAMLTGFLMPKLPGREADKVVVVSAINPDESFLPDVFRVSAPNYKAIHADTGVFASTAARTIASPEAWVANTSNQRQFNTHRLAPAILASSARRRNWGVNFAPVKTSPGATAW